MRTARSSLALVIAAFVLFAAIPTIGIAEPAVDELLKLHRYDDVISRLTSRADSPKTHFQLAKAYYGLDRFIEAATAFRKSADLAIAASDMKVFTKQKPELRALWAEGRICEAAARLRAYPDSPDVKSDLVSEARGLWRFAADAPEIAALVAGVASLCDEQGLYDDGFNMLSARFPNTPEFYELLREMWISAIVKPNLLEMRGDIDKLMKFCPSTDVYAGAADLYSRLMTKKEALKPDETAWSTRQAAGWLAELSEKNKNPFLLVYASSSAFNAEDYESCEALSIQAADAITKCLQPKWCSDARRWAGDKASILAYALMNSLRSAKKIGRANIDETLKKYWAAEALVDRFDPRSEFEATALQRGIPSFARIAAAEYLAKADNYDAALRMLCDALRMPDERKAVIPRAEEVFATFSKSSQDKLADQAARLEGVTRFVDVTAEVIPGGASGNRMAFCDINNDGYDDLLLDSRLYIFTNGKFVPADAKAMGLPEGGFQSGVWGDFDGDGFADLFLYGDEKDLLLKNLAGKSFEDVTAKSGLKPAALSTHAACWGDFNSDGLIDLYICNRENGWHLGHGTKPVYGPDQLFMNQGNGQFRDVSDSLDKWVARYSGRGVAPCDFDGDGRLDLYVTNYSLHPNALYSETGAGLRNIVWETDTAGVPSENAVETYYAHSIGACWADLDGDSRPDLLAPNFAHPRVINISDRSWIYFNSSDPGKPAFKGSRMIPYYETLTSPAAADFDGDGDMDFFLSATYADRPSHLFRNALAESGKLTFNDIIYASGALVYNGWGCVWHDYDGNGTPDLFATGDGKLVVLKNPVRANFVRVRITEPGVGFGAWVTVESGGKKRTYCLNGAKGSGDQEPMEVCAGLGASTSADRVTISFAGKTATKENIPAGSTVPFSLSELKAR